MSHNFNTIMISQLTKNKISWNSSFNINILSAQWLSEENIIQSSYTYTTFETSTYIISTDMHSELNSNLKIVDTTTTKKWKLENVK